MTDIRTRTVTLARDASGPYRVREADGTALPLNAKGYATQAGAWAALSRFYALGTPLDGADGAVHVEILGMAHPDREVASRDEAFVGRMVDHENREDAKARVIRWEALRALTGRTFALRAIRVSRSGSQTPLGLTSERFASADEAHAFRGGLYNTGEGDTRPSGTRLTWEIEALPVEEIATPVETIPAEAPQATQAPWKALRDFALATGTIAAQHRAMVARRATTAAWQAHVAGTVVAFYRAAIDHKAEFMLIDTHKAGLELQAHYVGLVDAFGPPPVEATVTPVETTARTIGFRAVQCAASTGEVGCYLYQGDHPSTGALLSPVFPSSVPLFDWIDANGFTRDAYDPEHPCGVYSRPAPVDATEYALALAWETARDVSGDPLTYSDAATREACVRAALASGWSFSQADAIPGEWPWFLPMASDEGRCVFRDGGWRFYVETAAEALAEGGTLDQFNMVDPADDEWRAADDDAPAMVPQPVQQQQARDIRRGMARCDGPGLWQIGIYEASRLPSGMWRLVATGPGTWGDGSPRICTSLAGAYLAATGEEMPGQEGKCLRLVPQPVQQAQGRDLRPYDREELLAQARAAQAVMRDATTSQGARYQAALRREVMHLGLVEARAERARMVPQPVQQAQAKDRRVDVPTYAVAPLHVLSDVAQLIERHKATAPEADRADWQEVANALYALGNDTDCIVTDPEDVLTPGWRNR